MTVFIKEICVTWERKGSNTERGGLKKGQELSKSVCIWGRGSLAWGNSKLQAQMAWGRR